MFSLQNLNLRSGKLKIDLNLIFFSFLWENDRTEKPSGSTSSSMLDMFSTNERMNMLDFLPKMSKKVYMYLICIAKKTN